MIPLENAHDCGAENWTKKQKRAFANDPENLFSVDLSANRSKGSRCPALDLPQRKVWAQLCSWGVAGAWGDVDG